jgi:hypothetical protein
MGGLREVCRGRWLETGNGDYLKQLPQPAKHCYVQLLAWVKCDTKSLTAENHSFNQAE